MALTTTRQRLRLTHKAYTTNTDAAAEIITNAENIPRTFSLSLPVMKFKLVKKDVVYTGTNVYVPVTFTVNNSRTAQMLTDAIQIMNNKTMGFIRIDNLIEIDGKFQLDVNSPYLLSRGVAVQVGNISNSEIASGYYDIYPNSDGTILKVGVAYTIPQRGPVFTKETSVGRTKVVITITTKTEEEARFIHRNLSRIQIDNLYENGGILYQDSSIYKLHYRGIAIQVFEKGWVNNKGYYEKNFSNHGGTIFTIDKPYISTMEQNK